tara:strand:- start:1159 stop:4422 length:3264 start_codon:yes stop_codon:yes gene_type:complete
MNNFPRPSEIMRHNRPYLFSDSKTEGVYILAKSELSHHLESLTQRNQHQDFEIFARKLCEREICPNLRPQTGPEGGGDGKVDTETYSVAPEISDRWFQGLPGSGAERWGFAFSAKEKWAPKVRSDVQGIVDTGRSYDRIIFVTSRAARSKDRLRVEDELVKKFNVPVTIHDRSWIIDRVFEHDHKDLAYEYLKAGQYDESKMVVGPRDFERRKTLDALEERIAKGGQNGGEITQRVVDALEAAQLSRMLERPRIETVGRFDRAIKLAKKHGTRRQKMQAIYEGAWTDLWWFDEIDAINESYEEIEALAFEENHADDISKLSNLYTVLTARVMQGWEGAEELEIEARGERLRVKVQEISADASRPNNALYGKALGHLLELSSASVKTDVESLDAVWNGLSDVIDQAHGLGEFPAEMIDQVIDALQPFAPASDAFDALVLKLAEFMGERAKEGKAGKILFRRGEQRLEAEEPIEAIRWLGKASIYFMKEEYAEEQFETLYCLSVAYRGAGLLWAARATSLSSLVRMVILSDGTDGPRPELVPSASLFAMISIQLGRFVDALNVILWLNSLHEVLPLSDEGREGLRNKLLEFDRLLMCQIVNLEADDLRALSTVPDMLEKLRLFSARMALILLLGHAESLEQDGSIPEEGSIDELKELAELAAVQPAARDLPKRLLMYQNREFEASVILLGVKVKFTADASVFGHLLCEAHIGALEGFLATSIETGMLAHASELSVSVEICEDLGEPDIIFDPGSMMLTVKWPVELDVRDVAHHQTLCDHLIDFCARVIDAIAVVNPDKDNGFMSQLVDEFVIQRSISFSNACIGNHRLFGTHASTIAGLQFLSEREYQLKSDAPTVIRGAFLDERRGEDEGFTDPEKIVQSHRGYVVESIINLHLWDRAGWNGIMFAGYGPAYPPMLALIFRDEQTACSIFSGWRDKFGSRDKEDAIRIALLRGVDAQHPSHYRASISKNFDPKKDGLDPSKKFMQASRMLTITPPNSNNLDTFLSDFEEKQCFILAPAVLGPEGEPQFFTDLSILKRMLYVREAWEVGVHDQDGMALRSDDNILVPDGIENPPCFELMELKKRLREAR